MWQGSYSIYRGKKNVNFINKDMSKHCFPQHQPHIRIVMPSEILYTYFTRLTMTFAYPFEVVHPNRIKELV